MRTLDRYIIGSFLYTALLFFVIIISLRVVLDLNFNLDEFLKGSASSGDKFSNIVSYYTYQVPWYIIELGGIIIVASAAFTLARMNHSNELTAILASGVSLRRVVVPIFLFAVLLDVGIICNQEYLIPSIAGKMIRERKFESKTSIQVRLMTDEAGAVWYSQSLNPETRTMDWPVVLVRSSAGTMVGLVSGSRAKEGRLPRLGYGWSFADGQVIRPNANWIETPNTQRVFTHVGPEAMIQSFVQDRTKKENLTPEQARELEKSVSAGITRADFGDSRYGMRIKASRFEPGPAPAADSEEPRGGKLIEPQFVFTGEHREMLGIIRGSQALWVMEPSGGYWRIDGGSLFFPSDLKSDDIKLRHAGRWLDYMSIGELGRLIRDKKVPDLNAALQAKHIRFTDPINNIVMLLLGLPFILSRERNIKASAALCLLFVAMFYVFIYICRYMNVDPTIAAWLPILLFGPVSAVMLDSVKT